MKKKFFLLLLSFLIPFLVVFLVFSYYDLYGHKTLLMGDLSAQYYPLFKYLKGLFLGNNSLFFSFTKGIGGTMFGTFFYYLSSPLNLFLYFFKDIINFITILIPIKVGLCGFTMYLYMRRKYKTDNLLLLSFSLCYALMGYNINYMLNIMWLDVVFLTPLVLIGVDNILSRKSSCFYILTLFISILSNYYLSYMLCIFSCLYFFHGLLLKYDLKKDRDIVLNIIKRFFISSLFSGLLCSFFLVPCFFEMLSYGRSESFFNIFHFDYNFFDLFSKTYLSSLYFFNSLNYSSMNLYCGIIVMPLVYLFLINKKIDKKERKYSLVLILIMIAPCFIYLFNYIWHLFTVPSFYSYRYSFLLCFFLINIAYKSLINLDITKKKIVPYILLYSVISVYFIIFSFYTSYYDFLSYKNILLTLIFLLLYIFLLFKDYRNKSLFISSFIIIELILNVILTFYKMSYFNFEFKNRSDLEIPLSSEILDKYNDDRIEFYSTSLSNPSLKDNYHGLSTFLSSTNKDVLFFLFGSFDKNYRSDINYFSYTNQSFIMDSLMGVRYLSAPRDVKYYDKLLSYSFHDVNYTLYENKNSLGIGYVVKNACNNIDFSFLMDQNILDCLVDDDHSIYEKIDYILSDNELKLKLDRKGFYFVSSTNIDERVDDSSIEPDYIASNYIKYYNDTLDNSLKITLNDTSSPIDIYYFNYDSFISQIRKIDDILDYKIEDDKINGNIKTDGGIMLLTIPYERGYKIRVDGNNVDYFKVLNAFVGFNLEKGEHSIEVDYEQPYFKEGIALSLISFVMVVIYVKRENIR